MANAKLTQKTELTILADDDWGYVVDISDLLESPQGTSKKFRFSTIWDYIRGKADIRYVGVPKIRFIGDGIQDTFDIGTPAVIIKAVFLNGGLVDDDDWSQTGTEFTLTFIPANGDLIKPI